MLPPMPGTWNPKSRTTALLLALAVPATAQQGSAAEGAARQDQLRGSITPERAWWDVQHYDLALQVLPATKSLKGANTITFKTLQIGDKLQIDLQPPLAITRVTHGGTEL